MKKAKESFSATFYHPPKPYSPSSQDLAMVSSAKVSLPQKPNASTYSREFQIRGGKLYCPARYKIKQYKKGEIESIKRKFRDNTPFKQFIESYCR